MTNFELIMRELPPNLQQEVQDFAQFLLMTKVRQPSQRTDQEPTFAWAGALSDLKDQYNSVELQHQVLKWRVGEE